LTRSKRRMWICPRSQQALDTSWRARVSGPWRGATKRCVWRLAGLSDSRVQPKLCTSVLQSMFSNLSSTQLFVAKVVSNVLPCSREQISGRHLPAFQATRSVLFLRLSNAPGESAFAYHRASPEMAFMVYPVPVHFSGAGPLHLLEVLLYSADGSFRSFRIAHKRHVQTKLHGFAHM